MRLIDAEAKICESKDWKKLNDKEKLNVTKFIISQPTIEAEIIKHGKWIKVHPIQENDVGGYKCSICSTGFYDANRFNYCPECGAKMMW